MANPKPTHGSLLDSRLALLNPEFKQAGETRNHQQANGRDGPTGHASTVRVVDDCHDDAQRRSDRRNHVADPVDQVEEGPLGLSRRLSLDGFVGGGRAAKVLGLNQHWGQLKENYENEK